MHTFTVLFSIYRYLLESINRCVGLSLYSDNKLSIIGTCRSMCKVKAFVILIKSMFVKCTAHVPGILAMVS